jgi:hypothetical protein
MKNKKKSYTKDARIFQKSRSRSKILGVGKVIRSKFSTENTLKPGATTKKNVDDTATRCPEFVHPCITHLPISANDLNHCKSPYYTNMKAKITYQLCVNREN